MEMLLFISNTEKQIELFQSYAAFYHERSIRTDILNRKILLPFLTNEGR